jgi:hypothetical protein
MRTSTKAILASLVIVLIPCVFLLVYLFVYIPSLYSPETMREKGEAGHSQGLAAGRRLDQIECFRKASFLAGKKTLEARTAGPWLYGCLESSKPSAGFCDGIPPPSEHPDLDRQQLACRARDLGEYCLFFMPTVEAFCHSG